MNRRRVLSLTTTSLAVLLIASASLAHGSDSCDGWEESDSWGDKGRYCEIREIMLADLGTLAVDSTPNGGVRVTAWDRAEIRVEARFHKAGVPLRSATATLNPGELT